MATATLNIPHTTTTDHGRGFLPLFVRAMAHALFVIGARLHEWPMTVELATAELREGRDHIDHVITATPTGLLSDEAIRAIASWRDHLTSIIDGLTAVETADPETKVQTLLTQEIQKFTTNTFALCQVLDDELLGLRGDASDAGRLP